MSRAPADIVVYDHKNLEILPVEIAHVLGRAFQRPPEVIEYGEAVRRYAGVDPSGASLAERPADVVDAASLLFAVGDQNHVRFLTGVGLDEPQRRQETLFSR